MVATEPGPVSGNPNRSPRHRWGAVVSALTDPA
jgi:hypothetical protein